jgi:hypothetical protein
MKTLSNTKISASPDVFDLDVLYFPKMKNCSPKEYRTKKGTSRFSKTHKLMIEMHGIHVAFRKATDSHASGIIWNCIGCLKKRHRLLLIDTMTNILPKSLDTDNELENEEFSHYFIHMWNTFFKRLYGLDGEGFEYNRSIMDSLRSQSEMYRTIISNLECALKIEAKENNYKYFTQFMYCKEEK